MIRFERNTKLDIAMNNLMLSMVDVNDYITSILNYTGKILTQKEEKELQLGMRKQLSRKGL